jgi:hypothetical protein
VVLLSNAQHTQLCRLTQAHMLHVLSAGQGTASSRLTPTPAQADAPQHKHPAPCQLLPVFAPVQVAPTSHPASKPESSKRPHGLLGAPAKPAAAQVCLYVCCVHVRLRLSLYACRVCIASVSACVRVFVCVCVFDRGARFRVDSRAPDKCWLGNPQRGSGAGPRTRPHGT